MQKFMYWQRVPLGWRDAPAVSALAAHIRKRDPRLLLLDLWDWACCHGHDHKKSIAADAIERGAGWRGKRGVLYAGLVATGWVVESDTHARIVDWEKDDVVRGRPTMSGVVPADEIHDIAEKLRINARVRQSRRRAKQRDASRDGSVTERDSGVTCHGDSVTESVTSRDSDVTDPSDLAESPVKPVFVTAQEREEDRDKERDKNKNLAPIASDAASEELFPVEPKRRGRPPKEPSEIVADRERWLTAARSLIGLTPEETPVSSKLCIAFANARKRRGIDQLMRSLDGLNGDKFASSSGLMTLLSDSIIERGLATRINKRAEKGQDIPEVWAKVEANHDPNKEIGNGWQGLPRT